MLSADSTRSSTSLPGWGPNRMLFFYFDVDKFEIPFYRLMALPRTCGSTSERTGAPSTGQLKLCKTMSSALEDAT